MEQGQLILSWDSSTTGSLKIKVDSVASAIVLYNGFVDSQVDDESVGFNMGGLEFFDRDMLEPEYDCDDGMTDFRTVEGFEFEELVDELRDKNIFGREDIIRYLKEKDIQGEILEIKMY